MKAAQSRFPRFAVGLAAASICLLLAFPLMEVAPLPWSLVLSWLLLIAILSPLLLGRLPSDPFCIRTCLMAGLIIFYALPALDLTMISSWYGPFIPSPLNFFYRQLPRAEDAKIAFALAVALIGTLALWLGYFAFGKRRPARGTAPAAAHPTVYTFRSLWLPALLTIFLGACGFGLEIQAAGSYQKWQAIHWASRGDFQGEIEGAVGTLKVLLVPGALMLFAGRLLRRKKFWFDPAWLFIVPIAGFLANIGTRKFAIWIMLGTAICYHRIKRPLSMMTSAAVCSFLLLSLVFLDNYRSIMSSTRLGDRPADTWDAIRNQSLHTLLLTSTDASLVFDGYLSILSDVPDRVHPLWGSTYYKLLFLPVPRSLYPAKPVGMNEQITYNFYSDAFVLTGASTGATVMGEAYFNFLIPGVIIVMLLLGGIARRIEPWWNLADHRPDVALWQALAIPFLLEVFRSDSRITFEYALQFGALVISLRWARARIAARVSAQFPAVSKRMARIA